MNDSVEKLKTIILETLDNQKAQNTLCVDLKSRSAFADYVIVSTGTSGRHLKTLQEKISEECKKQNFKTLYVEGEQTGNWVIMDFEHIIVHLFREEVRAYYDFDRIWDEY